MTLEEVNELVKLLPDEDKEKVSDGYHSFKELYDHRVTLWIALCNIVNHTAPDFVVWKSKKHSDGSTWDGWFLAGIGVDKGEQMTYHLPMSVWDDLEVDERITAPSFDGHTPSDVLARIKKYFF